MYSVNSVGQWKCYFDGWTDFIEEEKTSTETGRLIFQLIISQYPRRQIAMANSSGNSFKRLDVAAAGYLSVMKLRKLSRLASLYFHLDDFACISLKFKYYQRVRKSRLGFCYFLHPLWKQLASLMIYYLAMSHSFHNSAAVIFYRKNFFNWKKCYSVYY